MSHDREGIGADRTTAASRADRAPWAAREVAEEREKVEAALRSYAESIHFWNAPDDEHSKIQLRRLVEEVIADEFA